MNLIGNIIWLLFGGLLSGLGWFLTGILWSITIIGLPIGRQCFKFAALSLMPFGKTITYGGDGISLLANVLWLIFGGVEMAIGHVIIGCVFYITIIGIPFGKQHFKLAKLALMPFGARVE